MQQQSRITEIPSDLERSSKRQSSMQRESDLYNNVSNRKKNSVATEKDYEEDFDAANSVAVGENIDPLSFAAPLNHEKTPSKRELT